MKQLRTAERDTGDHVRNIGKSDDRAMTQHTPEIQARTFSTGPETHTTPKRQHRSGKAIQLTRQGCTAPEARHTVPAQRYSTDTAVQRQGYNRQRHRHGITAVQRHVSSAPDPPRHTQNKKTGTAKHRRPGHIDSDSPTSSPSRR